MNSRFTYLLLVGSLLLCACKRDIEEEEEIIGTSHQSVLVDNAGGWESVYFTESFFSNYINRYNFETYIVPKGITVTQGQPIMWASHAFQQVAFYERVSQVMHYPNPRTGTMTTSSLPYNFFTTNSPTNPFKAIQPVVPANIEELLISTGMNGTFTQPFLPRLKPFFYGNEVWAWSDYWRKVFGSDRRSESYRMLSTPLLYGPSSYGWANVMGMRRFPTGYFETDVAFRNHVAFDRSGTLDVYESGAQEIIAYAARFYANPQPNDYKYYYCMLGKTFQADYDSLEHIAVLPYNADLDYDETTGSSLPSVVTKAIGTQLFTAILAPQKEQLHFVIGNFNDGFNYMYKLENVVNVIEVLEGNDHFYCIWENASGEYQAARISLGGQVTVLSTFDRPGSFDSYSFTHYKGDLILGFSDEEVERKATVYRISDSGVSLLGTQGFTQEATEVVVGSDGNMLYASVMNCVSPVYEAAEQFCGWEIVRFDP
ncbi:MAG: hypothetical protein AAFU33_11815 [Bacteroidota bacterium]